MVDKPAVELPCRSVKPASSKLKALPAISGLPMVAWLGYPHLAINILLSGVLDKYPTEYWPPPEYFQFV